MKTYIALLGLLVLGLGLARAQAPKPETVDYRPKKGDFTGAVLFGRGNFLNNVDVPASPGNNSLWTVNGTAPFANTVNGNANNIGNIAGAEARYFIKDRIALKLSGGFIQRSTPALDNVQQFFVDENGTFVDGNDPSTSNEVWIPSYSAINENQVTEFNISLGGEYHFSSRFGRLAPYVGVNLNYYYARTLEYDPTVLFSGSTQEPDFTTTDVEARTARVYGLGYQFTGGADFYLLKGLYMGFEVRPLTFIYAYSQQLPSPGLPVLEADTYTWSFFTQTHFKIGFRI